MAKKDESNKEQNNKRAYDWTFIIYPESAPENWKSILVETFGFKGFVSPLHDKDVLDDVDNTPKKAHYHVIARFPSKKSFNQIKEITEALNQPIPQPVKSIEGAVRYLAHVDSPDKYQYDPEGIECIGNVDKSRYFTMSKDAKIDLTGEIMDYITENGILEISDLLDYARVERWEWFKHLNENAYLIDKYITSKRNKQQKQKVSPDVEILVKAMQTAFFGEIK